MDRFQNILVGVDLSDGTNPVAASLSASSRAAVDKAIAVAGRTSAKVTFFSTLMPCLELTADARHLIEMQRYQDLIDGLHGKACERLTELVAEAREAGVDAHEVRVTGTPWMELIRQVIDEKHDLVLVGSHRQHALGRLLLGSTGRRLVRKCPCPVWVTSPAEYGTVKSVLAPTDFSPTADTAVALAHSLAQQFGAEFHVFHSVAYHFEPSMRDLIIPASEIDQYRSHVRQDAERELDEHLVRAGIADSIDLDHRHVTAGPAHQTIQDAVRRFNTDLVVMGTQARAGVSGVLIGNTAERVLSHLTCSVLAVKPEGFQCPVEFPEPCGTQAESSD